LQDNRRAVIVGERTFGKGTVQQMLPLGKSLLKLTWASFRRPNGANINRVVGAPETEAWGVSPDVGYERKVSAENYRTYRKSRARRDEYAEEDLDADAPPFIDEPVETARQYLQVLMDKAPETSL
jgi:carboxyl-terminal processing protease